MPIFTKKNAKKNGSKGGKNTAIIHGLKHMKTIASKGGSRISDSGDNSFDTEKRAGVKYYKCKTCGAVGNWEAMIVTGDCHKGRRINN